MCVEDFSVDFRWYNSLDKRLVTFKNWTGYLKPIYLALAGFYFIGKTDCVRCFTCGVEISEWCVDDIPLEQHLKFSERCPYAVLIQDALPMRESSMIYKKTPLVIYLLFFAIFFVNLICWIFTIFFLMK